MLKRIICIVFAVLFLLTFSVPVFADGEAETEITDIEVDSFDTGDNVDFELIQMDIDRTLYPVDMSTADTNEGAGVVQCVNLYEYCYSVNKYMSEHYALYLYLYSPSCMTFENTSKNKVSLSVDKTNYELYNIEYLGATQDGTITKWKVLRDDRFNQNIYAKVGPGQREYYVADVQLQKNGSDKSTAYSMASHYIYQGYDNYCDNELTANGCLMEFYDTMTVIDLPVTLVRYTTDSSEDGLGYHHVLHSVYFKLDQLYIDMYGELCGVKADWDEYDLYPLLVTTNEDLSKADYYAYFSYFGDYYEYNNTFNSRHFPIQYYYNSDLQDPGFLYCPTLIPFIKLSCGIDKSSFSTCNNSEYSNYSNGIYYKKSLTDKILIDEIIKDRLTKDNYNVEVAWSPDRIPYEDWKEQKMNEIVYNYDNCHKTQEVTVDDSYNFLSYMSTRDWWTKFWSTGLELFSKVNFGEDVNVEKALLQVTKDDVKVDSSDIKNLFYIDDYYISDFVNYVKQNDTDTSNVYLLRFTSTEKYTGNACVKTVKSEAYTRMDNEAILVKDVAISDFSVISLTFNKEGVYTVVPVSCTPVSTEFINGSFYKVTPVFPLFPGLPGTGSGLNPFLIVLSVIGLLIFAYFIVWFVLKIKEMIEKNTSSKKGHK